MSMKSKIHEYQGNKLLRMSKRIFPLLAFSLILCGCANDSTDDLTDFVPVDNVTYTNTVKSIIDNNCLFCHAAVPVNGAPMSLTTYEKVREAVQNRGLLDRISRAQGSPGMMPNGGTRLPQNQIDLIFQWSQQGLQE